MSQALLPFFTHCFDRHFTRFSAEWVDLTLGLFEEARDLIASDAERKFPTLAIGETLPDALAEVLETDAAFQGTLLYRLAHALFRREPQHPALNYLAHIMKVRSGMEIYYSSEIGPRFLVMHGTGIVLGPRYKIGSDFTIYQGVTLGQRRQHSSHEHLSIGDRCIFFAGAKVLGNLTIGDDVKVGANAVLLSNAESNSTYAGAPAVKVS